MVLTHFVTKLLQVVVEGHESGQVDQLGFKSGCVRRGDIGRDGTLQPVDFSSLVGLNLSCQCLNRVQKTCDGGQPGEDGQDEEVNEGCDSSAR